MIEFAALKSGQVIQLNDERTGIIRFTGLTHFAPKEWVGIELEDASGKNDGSVQGQRYFECEAGHGMFLRTSGIAHILEEPTPKPTKPAAGATKAAVSSATASKARAGGSATPQTNGVRRPSILDPAASKRQSINAASPTPTARRQTLAPPNGTHVPAKSAARGVGSTATSSAASSRGATPSTARKTLTSVDRTVSSRQSLAPQSTRPSASTSKPRSPTSSASSTRPRTSIAPPTAVRLRTTTTSSAASKSVTEPPARSSHRLAPRPPQQPNGLSKLHSEPKSECPLSSQIAEDADDDDSMPDSAASDVSYNDASQKEDTENSGPEDDLEEQSDEPQDDESDASRQEQAQADPKPPQPKKPPDDRPPPKPGSRVTAHGRKIEELEAQIKILERKRDEDKERLARIEKLQAEKDKYEKIIQTLQAKYGPQTQELQTLRARLKEAEKSHETIEKLKLDHENDIELATLDREMAEETAESLRTELDAVKQKTEELELEVEVLREENSELGKEMSPEERTSQGWLQIERSNERLREALFRLREMSQEREAELNEQIAEKDQMLEQLQGVEERCYLAKEQLERSETAVEDLKQQLEAALTAEEMVEELTETNNNLNDQISQLRSEMEDLQTINELNDEFEQQHQENEKQMQEELDTRAATLAEQAARAVQQDGKLNDYEYTIAKFRDLVSSLQTHLEDMKASRQITEAEAEELNSRSKAMTDLNRKLQSSATKTQLNIIDLEIRRMEAQEAAEHLTIVQMFLPDSFRSERKSVLAYLKFKRVTFKANLLQSLLHDKLVSNSNGVESSFVLCNLVDKLAWVSAMCNRFSSDMTRCPIERFAWYEGSLQDLDPIERALNAYTNASKRDDLRAEQAVEELDRSIAVLRHLGEIRLQNNDPANFADDLIMRSALLQSYLETAASAFTCSKSLISSAAPNNDSDENEKEEDEDEVLDNYLDELDNAISQTRNTKVIAGKISTSLSDYHARTMTLEQDHSNEPYFEAFELTATFSHQAQALGNHLMPLTSLAEDDPEPLAIRIRKAFLSFHHSIYPDITKPTSPLAGVAQHLKRIYTLLTSLSKAAADATSYIEFTVGPAPWITRAEEIKATSAANVATEGELGRLKDVMQDRLSQLRLKDQRLEEQDVKISLLESRTRGEGERTKTVEEMRKNLDVGKKREAELVKALGDVSNQVEGLKEERDKMRKVVEERKELASEQDGRRRGNRAIASAREVETLKLEVRSLQGAVRYLNEGRGERGLVRDDRDVDLGWLKEPLFQSKTPQAKAEAEGKEKLQREGNDVLDGLLRLAMTTQLVDLKRLPVNKLAWRPAKEKNRWLLARQKEEWARWHGRSDHFLGKARSQKQSS